MLLPDEGAEQGDDDGDGHADETEEQEVGGRAEVHPEHGCRADKEAGEGSARTDMAEEDSHDEQTADATGKEPENGVKVVEQRLDVDRCHEDGDEHAYKSGDDARDAGRKESAPVADVWARFFVDVNGEGGGDAVDVGGDGGHSCREDGGNEQACQASWQLAHHEEGEDGVVLLHGEVHGHGVGLVEGVETGSDGEEGNGNEDAHQTVGHDASGGALLVLGGEVALNDGLVAGVANEVVGNAAEDDNPEGSGAIVEGPVE